jgi:hypothetical protein
LTLEKTKKISLYMRVFFLFHTIFCVISITIGNILVFWYCFIIFKFKKLCWIHVYLDLTNKQNPSYLVARPKALGFGITAKSNSLGSGLAARPKSFGSKNQLTWLTGWDRATEWTKLKQSTDWETVDQFSRQNKISI